MRMRFQDRQRGVAVITALLLTTLAVTIVGSLFWQQQVQVRSIENQRLQLQKQWILRGALDWTRLILGEDRRIDERFNRRADHLGEPWAVPLAETRLDQYVENDSADGARDATLSGGIADAQARYNLKDLCRDGKIDDKEVARFGKLLTLLQVNPALARETALLMQSAQKRASPSADAPAGATDASTPLPMDLQHADDLLAVQGFTPELLEKIKDYVIVLPTKEMTPININTAPAEVIAAKIGTLSLSDASTIVATRQNRPFLKKEDVSLPPSTSDDDRKAFTVMSSYFLINGNVRLNRAGMEMQALIHRESPVKQTVLWIREN